MAEPQYLECMKCGHTQIFQPYDATCEKCESTWIEPYYNYHAFKRELLRGLPGKPSDLWRYQDVLPIKAPDKVNLVCAGGTPLIHSKRYAKEIGHNKLYIKDERQGPTSSFKDRQAAVAVASLQENSIKECVIASTGNAGVAYAAACAQVGIKLWVFMTSSVPQAKLREAALFGAEVVKVSGNYDQTKQIAGDFAKKRGLLYDRGAKSLPARESMKTIAYEIIEQLEWEVPDWYVQAVSGGMGPLGVYHGFLELHQMGLIDKVPSLLVGQAEGCSPMAQAFKAGQSVATPVVPATLIAILSTGDPGQTYTRLWHITQDYGGYMESVTDREAFKAMHDLARIEGIAVEPAAAVAFASFEKLTRQNIIKPDELVVINCTGHTFPVEKHVLGDEWFVDVHLSDDQTPAPREGLQQALEHLDEKATTVLIVEDNDDDALLIQRILEQRKSYRVFRATNGADGAAIAKERMPDLIISDLTMPEMDGFNLLTELKRDERTCDIPVIIVSAKDITAEERMQLSEMSRALYQKGSLSPLSFVEQVVQVIEDKTE